MKQEQSQQEIDDLIVGYFTQSLEDHETHRLHDWLSGSQENKAHFLQAQNDWFLRMQESSKFRFDERQAYEIFLSRTKTKQKESRVMGIKRPKVFLGRAAAAIALLLVFSASGYWLGNQKKGSHIGQLSVEAPLGSRTRMLLPDGSMVWLNAGSNLSYSQDFGLNNRTVHLEGEGYFEVKKNRNLPFIVRSKKINVKVLGTKFNFRNFRDEEEARVTLLEGKVQTTSGANSNKENFLTPDQQIVLNKKTGDTRISRIEARYASVWTKGLIFFDEERLPDIAKELERSYNVKIVIADDSLRSYRFYGNFTRTEQTIQEVLEVLASTDRLKYKVEGKQITLSLRQ